MAGPPFQPPSQPVQPVSYATVQAPLSTGMAIGAMVCGIIGIVTCLFPIGIVGVILGIIAIVRASHEPHRYGGKGMAVAGICTGAISIVTAGLFLPSVALPALVRGRVLAKRTIAASHLGSIGSAAFVYANQYDGCYPPNLQVLVDEGLIKADELIDLASLNEPPACDFYYVSGLTTKDDPHWIVAYSDPAVSNGEGANVLFVDSHVEWFEEPALSEAIDDFQAAYQQRHRRPPTILKPQ